MTPSEINLNEDTSTPAGNGFSKYASPNRAARRRSVRGTNKRKKKYGYKPIR